MKIILNQAELTEIVRKHVETKLNRTLADGEVSFETDSFARVSGLSAVIETDSGWQQSDRDNTYYR